MDINELETFRLEDAVKFHDRLNPKLWGADENLLPEVREKLLAIAEDFREFLGISDLKIQDITVSGSNAAYTYTAHSDIDLHLVVDFPTENNEVYRELFDAKKYQYNDQHNFKIGGADVELYVQDADQTHVSQGIYSVRDDRWISVPKRRKPDVNDISVKSKYEDIGHRVDAAIESGSLEQMEAIAKKIREMRQAGLEKTGEFGAENLAFKVLRNNGTLEKLRNASHAAKDSLMSLEERKKKKAKKKFKYGRFGGYFFPGYHYYDQDSSDGGDAGGEGVQEQLDVKTFNVDQIASKHGVSVEQIKSQLAKGIKVELEHTTDPKVAREIALDHLLEFPDYYDRLARAETNENTDQTKSMIRQFVSFCAQNLKLKQLPQIRLKRDPAWSERNATFGRYMPDQNVLIISVTNRHPLDIMRTLAHELTHHRQQEQQGIPVGAGTTGSKFEDEANAEAGVILRKFAELHPEYFGKRLDEASGYIPVNDKEAQDPRYSMAITQDIKPGEPQRQAAKMGWTTDAAGVPPLLMQKLQNQFRVIKEGRETVNEQDLEEVAMSPGALKAFADSPEAAGMMAGFEAELVFTGLGESEDMEPEWEPDYDQDTRAFSIDEIIEFFQYGDFSDLSDRAANRLRSEMENDYQEWLYDHMSEEWNDDSETLIRDYLKNEEGLEGEELDERVAAAIEEENSDYDNARESFEDDWRNNTSLDESDWLVSQGIRYMTDAERAYDLMWPHMIDNNYGSSEGGFNEENAQRLADDLADKLDVITTVSGGYHSAKRDATTWIFEPDSSLDADDIDDMPVEIVSPPMPLKDALEILPKFFAWAESNGAYANKSTGFHMSVSMPDHQGANLDYTKLALFLGDEHVLKEFGRAANTYAASAVKKIRQRINETNAEEVMNRMRQHLDQFATQALATPTGFGKYTSINPKGKYIEFRSAGGSDYFRDMDKIQNTLMRYARATSLAMDPAAEKSEYAKKLYKLLSKTETQQVTDPKTGRKRIEVKGKNDDDAISIFSRYVAGELPQSALKSFLKQIQYKREVSKNPPAEKIQWRVTHPNGRDSLIFQASSAEEAIQLAKQEYNDRMNPDSVYRAEPYVPQIPQGTVDVTPPDRDQDAITAGSIPLNNPRGVFVMRRREGNDPVGPVLYRFDAPNNAEAIQIARRWAAARGLERHTVWLDHVVSVPDEVLADYDRRHARQNAPAQQPTGEFTGQWRIVLGSGPNAGVELTRFGGIGNSQEDANRHAARWLANNGYGSGTEVEVVPVMR